LPDQTQDKMRLAFRNVLSTDVNDVATDGRSGVEGQVMVFLVKFTGKALNEVATFWLQYINKTENESLSPPHSL